MSNTQAPTATEKKLMRQLIKYLDEKKVLRGLNPSINEIGIILNLTPPKDGGIYEPGFQKEIIQIGEGFAFVTKAKFIDALAEKDDSELSKILAFPKQISLSSQRDNCSSSFAMPHLIQDLRGRPDKEDNGHTTNSIHKVYQRAIKILFGPNITPDHIRFKLDPEFFKKHLS